MLHHNPLGLLKKGHFFGGSKERMLDFFYSISKQGTKAFFFFLGGGGGGGGVGGGDKDRVLKGIKTIWYKQRT